jgi:U2-associated protein SR140
MNANLLPHQPRLLKDELKAIQEEREKRHQIKTYHKEMSEYESGSRRSRFEPAAPAGLLQSQALGLGGGGGGGGGSSNTALNSSGRIAPPSELDYPGDSDNHSTTNLFLGNLNPVMTEPQLMETFGRYGPLASIKIMYPRTDEERAKGRHCGFVAFMNR